MNTIIDVDRGVIMNNFIINLDAFIRIGGNQGDGQDDSERINALLLLLVTLDDYFHAQA